MKTGVGQTVTEPATATFSVTATGTALLYQWQVSVNAGTWNNIGGATSASYTTPATTVGNNGEQFRVQVSNTVGSVSSTASRTWRAACCRVRPKKGGG